jgi:hypothetical protein
MLNKQKLYASRSFLIFLLIFSTVSSLHTEELFLLESLAEHRKYAGENWLIRAVQEDGITEVSSDRARIEFPGDGLRLQGELTEGRISLSFLLPEPYPLKYLGILREVVLQEMNLQGVSVLTLIFMDAEGQTRLFPILFEGDREGYSPSWSNASYVTEVRNFQMHLSSMITDFPYWHFVGLDLKGRPGVEKLSIEMTEMKLDYDLNFLRY